MMGKNTIYNRMFLKCFMYSVYETFNDNHCGYLINQRDIQKASNTRPHLPTSVDDCSGEADIAEMWRKHCRDLFNSVKTKDFDSSVFNDMQ